MSRRRNETVLSLVHSETDIYTVKQNGKKYNTERNRTVAGLMLMRQIMGNKMSGISLYGGEAREFVCRYLATIVYAHHRRGGQYSQSATTNDHRYCVSVCHRSLY